MPNKTSSIANVKKARDRVTALLTKGRKAEEEEKKRQAVQTIEDENIPESDYEEDEETGSESDEYEYEEVQEIVKPPPKPAPTRKVKQVTLSEQEKLALVQQREEVKRLKAEARKALKAQEKQQQEQALKGHLESLLQSAFTKQTLELEKKLSVFQAKSDLSDAMKRSVFKT